VAGRYEVGYLAGTRSNGFGAVLRAGWQRLRAVTRLGLDKGGW